MFAQPAAKLHERRTFEARIREIRTTLRDSRRVLDSRGLRGRSRRNGHIEEGVPGNAVGTLAA